MDTVSVHISTRRWYSSFLLGWAIQPTFNRDFSESFFTWLFTGNLSRDPLHARELQIMKTPASTPKKVISRIKTSLLAFRTIEAPHWQSLRLHLWNLYKRCLSGDTRGPYHVSHCKMQLCSNVKSVTIPRPHSCNKTLACKVSLWRHLNVPL